MSDYKLIYEQFPEDCRKDFSQMMDIFIPFVKHLKESEQFIILDPLCISLETNGLIRIELIQGINVWKTPELPEKFYEEYKSRLKTILAFGICFENPRETCFGDCESKTEDAVTIILEHSSSHSFELTSFYRRNETFKENAPKKIIYESFILHKTHPKLFIGNLVIPSKNKLFFLIKKEININGIKCPKCENITKNIKCYESQYYFVCNECAKSFQIDDLKNNSFYKRIIKQESYPK